MHVDGTWAMMVYCTWFLCYDGNIIGGTLATMVYHTQYAGYSVGGTLL